MSDKSLADRLRGIVAWIRDGGEGCVRQPDPDELEGIADEVEELVDQNNDELRFENNQLRDRIASDGARIANLEAALREIAWASPWTAPSLEEAKSSQEIARAALDAEKADDVHHKGPVQ